MSADRAKRLRKRAATFSSAKATTSRISSSSSSSSASASSVRASAGVSVRHTKPAAPPSSSRALSRPSVSVSGRRTKPTAPPPPASSSRPLSRLSATKSASPTLATAELPPELQNLVLEHLDLEDFAAARHNPERLTPRLRRTFAEKVRRCSAPGACVAAYRALFRRHYLAEIRRDEARETKESKLERDAKTKDVADDDDDDDEKRAPRDSECVALCLSDTDDVERLLSAYMTDYTRGGDLRSPWRDHAGEVVSFMQSAVESVTGYSAYVSCRLVSEYYRDYDDERKQQWRLMVHIDVPANLRGPDERQNDPYGASLGPDPTHVARPEFRGATDGTRLRALSAFLADVVKRASAAPSPPLPPSSSSLARSPSDRKTAATSAPVVVTMTHTNRDFAFAAPLGVTATRVFSRIVAAVAYAFASVATVEPDSNHYVNATVFEATYVSPLPRQFALLRRAFPELPIRAMYRSETEGLVVSGYTNRHWPAITTPAAVREAIAAGVTSISAIRLL